MPHVLFIFGLLGYWWRRKKWRAIAGELGLELAERGLRLTGNWKDRAVTVEIYDRAKWKDPMARGTDYRTRAFTSLNVEIPWQLRIRKEGLGASFEKLVGADDIQTGDGEFDGRCMVESDDAQRTLSLLDGDTRGALAAALEDDSAILLERSQISTERRRRLSSAAKFREMLDREATVAEAIERSFRANQP